jgi:hypothetical protein
MYLHILKPHKYFSGINMERIRNKYGKREGNGRTKKINSPVSVVINVFFYIKRDLGEGAERLVIQLATLKPLIKVLLLPPQTRCI